MTNWTGLVLSGSNLLAGRVPVALWSARLLSSPLLLVRLVGQGRAGPRRRSDSLSLQLLVLRLSRARQSAGRHRHGDHGGEDQIRRGQGAPPQSARVPDHALSLLLSVRTTRGRPQADVVAARASAHEGHCHARHARRGQGGRAQVPRERRSRQLHAHIASCQGRR